MSPWGRAGAQPLSLILGAEAWGSQPISSLSPQGAVERSWSWRLLSALSSLRYNHF